MQRFSPLQCLPASPAFLSSAQQRSSGITRQYDRDEEVVDHGDGFCVTSMICTNMLDPRDSMEKACSPSGRQHETGHG